VLGKSPHQQQRTELFKNLLAHRLNPQHPLYLLARVIPWEKIEEAFAPQPKCDRGLWLQRQAVE
jgi:hypothetical protein